MKNQFCRVCNTTTPHNPLKKVGEFRCTQCGEPKRYGQKHEVAQNLGQGKYRLIAKP